MTIWQTLRSAITGKSRYQQHVLKPPSQAVTKAAAARQLGRLVASREVHVAPEKPSVPGRCRKGRKNPRNPNHDSLERWQSTRGSRIRPMNMSRKEWHALASIRRGSKGA
jgi:hypothetical protein